MARIRYVNSWWLNSDIRDQSELSWMNQCMYVYCIILLILLFRNMSLMYNFRQKMLGKSNQHFSSFLATIFIFFSKNRFWWKMPRFERHRFCSALIDFISLSVSFRPCQIKNNIYRTPAIISRSFYPISKDHFFVFKEVFSKNSVLMYGLYSRAASNQERLMMARVRYIYSP